MQLTVYSDYSFRVLLYLATMKKKTATVGEIADFYSISKNHLIKVVHHLAQQAFITSIQGKGGGILLARPPHQIRISEVIRKTEANLNLVECFDLKTNQCKIVKTCQLKGIFNEAFNAFFHVLDNFTLADATHERSTVNRIISSFK